MSVPHKKVIESILLLADEPVAAGLIGEVLERPTNEVETTLRELAVAYDSEDRGFVLREVAGGWRLYTSRECAPWLERFIVGQTRGRLSAAALEVLAIVAYKGPIARSQIAEIRGVDSDGVVKSLLNRGLVEETGRDSGPGAPVLFSLSARALEQLGLRSRDDLPPLAEFMPDADSVEDMEAHLSPSV